MLIVTVGLTSHGGLQSRLADKEAAEGRAASLEADNHELVTRLMELKATEVQRINETNRICEQMVRGLPGLESATAHGPTSDCRTQTYLQRL